MYFEPRQISYMRSREYRHNDLSRLLPIMAIGDKDPLAYPVIIGRSSQWTNEEVVELGGVNDLDILGVGGVNYVYA